MNNKEMWPDDKFINRQSNNPNRLKQFKLDEKFIKKYISNGNICDVGCSTGEFIQNINWKGNIYGMEINDYAKNIASNFINFDKNIFTESNFFDLVIFRGTIQHVDEPFRMIKAAYNSLRQGGYICFLATPNTNSILYKLKNNLPFLDWVTNYYIPGNKELKNVLENYGFKIKSIEYPYLNTPYCNFFMDHIKFILNVLVPCMFFKHAFWKSSMQIMAVKSE